MSNNDTITTEYKFKRKVIGDYPWFYKTLDRVISVFSRKYRVKTFFTYMDDNNEPACEIAYDNDKRGECVSLKFSAIQHRHSWITISCEKTGPGNITHKRTYSLVCQR